MISPVLFGRSLFCYSNFNFYYIYENKETNLIAESSHSNLELFLKIYKCYDFKQNKPRAYCNFIKYFFYLLEVAADVPKNHLYFYRILLDKILHRFFLRNITTTWKTPIIFGIFSIILPICCCHLVGYYLTKPR